MAVLRTTRVEEPAASGSWGKAGAPVPRPSGAGLWVGNFPSSEINCLEGSPHRDTMVASCSLMASMDDVPNLRDLHVLVLDDHQDTLDVFSTALRACNANVFTARTARDAVTIFKTVRLDAIVSDLAMPGEAGLWVVDQLRRLSVTKGGSVPALAVTAHWDKYTSKDEAGRSVGVMHDRRIPGGGALVRTVR